MQRASAGPQRRPAVPHALRLVCGGAIVPDDTDGFFETATVGDRMVPHGRTITEADVTNFDGVPGDFTHLHTDGERISEDAPVIGSGRSARH